MHKNKGSAVVEITLMVPVILGCIYFYIMSMLYLVEHGRMVDELSEGLYNNLSVANMPVDNEQKEGYEEKIYTADTRGEEYVGDINDGQATYEGNYEKYVISLNFRVDNSDPIKSLRRWQLIADTIR